jgi:dTDP-4-dehydrorhamnose reductase
VVTSRSSARERANIWDTTSLREGYGSAGKACPSKKSFYEIACGVSNVRRITIIGANGRLGAALAREYARDLEVSGFNRNHLDLGKLDQVRSTLSDTEFDVLINCAALTNVDYCQSHRDEAFLINAQAPRLLAEICSEKSARLIHISTDYVFDGVQDTPYVEEDPPAPLSVYAESKLAGEKEVLAVSPKNLVVRLSWVFGPDKPSFIDQIIQRARENETVMAVADKFSSPTYAIDAAEWLRRAWDKDAQGILHLCNSGACSWREWAQYAVDVCHSLGIPLKAERVGGVPLADMKNFVAQRPVYTVLSTSKFAALTGVKPRHWRAAVAEYISAHVAKK